MNFNCQVGRWRRSALACTVALWRHQRCPSRAAGHAVVTEVETVEVGMGREEEFLWFSIQKIENNCILIHFSKNHRCFFWYIIKYIMCIHIMIKTNICLLYNYIYIYMRFVAIWLLTIAWNAFTNIHKTSSCYIIMRIFAKWSLKAAMSTLRTAWFPNAGGGRILWTRRSSADPRETAPEWID